MATTPIVDRWWKRWQQHRQQKRVMRAMQSVKLSVVALNQAMILAGFGRDKRRQVWRDTIARRITHVMRSTSVDFATASWIAHDTCWPLPVR